ALAARLLPGLPDLVDHRWGHRRATATRGPAVAVGHDATHRRVGGAADENGYPGSGHIRGDREIVAGDVLPGPGPGQQVECLVHQPAAPRERPVDRGVVVGPAADGDAERQPAT